MRRKYVALRLLLVVVVLAMSGLPVLAATSVEITVTAKPQFSNGIIDFVITYISMTQLDLSWGFDSGAVNIMIRGEYNGYPDDIPDEDTEPSDGYLVYYGNGTSVSDTSVVLDENWGILYYKAWAQKADGKWFTSPDTGSEESAIMTLVAFFLFAGMMSFLSLRGSYWILKFLAGASWWALAVYWLNSPPSVVAQGSSVDRIVIVLFFIIGLSFMLMPFWHTKTQEGREVGGRFRLPFMSQEEEEAKPPSPSRSERNAAYRAKVNNSLRGRGQRRRY